MKLIAKIKEPVVVLANIEDKEVDFTSNLISASNAIERAKRNMFNELKKKILDQITCIGMEDVKFEVID